MANSAQVIIGYQGTQGSFSEAAVREYCARAPVKLMEGRPFKPFPFSTFRETILEFYRKYNGSEKPNLPDELLLPISNCNSRSVTDMQKELHDLDGWIAGEHFLLVEQCLLVNNGVKLEDVTQVWSMKPAIDQVTNIIKKKKLTVVYKHDTAAAAKELKTSGRRDVAAIASPQAGEIYKLDNLGNVCDKTYNYTHFLHIVPNSKRERFLAEAEGNEACITKIVLHGTLYPRGGKSPFQVFADNGIGVHEPIDADTGTFDHKTIILDMEGHLKSNNIRECFKQLKGAGFELRVKGCYRRHQIPNNTVSVRTRIPVLQY